MEIKLWNQAVKSELEESMEEGEKITLYVVYHHSARWQGQTKREVIANATDLYPSYFTTYQEALEEYRKQDSGFDYIMGTKFINVKWIEKETSVKVGDFLNPYDSEIILSK